MNYQKHYELLCDRAKDRELDCYTEKHRIVPGCMGGKYTPDNVAHLTAEEHYIAHQLLVKMYPEHGGLIYAALMMTLNLHGQRPNNKLYGWVRRKHSEARKEYWDDPEVREQKSRQMKEYYKDPEAREQVSQRNKERWNDFENREQHSQRMKKYWKDHPDALEQHSQRMKKYYEDHPDALEQRSQRLKEYCNDLEVREQMAERTKQQWQNPEYRKHQSQRLKEYWQSPKGREQKSKQTKGTRWFYNPKTGQNIRRKSDAKIPDGFIPGRV